MKYFLLLLVLFIGVFTATPALAIDIPDDIEVVDVKVFRNLAETGDCLYVFEYNVEYTDYTSDNYSDTPAADSWIFRLIHSDGSTIKSSSTPYVYPYFETNGYSYGVSAFYFGASDNASPWGTNVTIQLYGWPAFYTPAQSETYILAAGDYSSGNTTTEERQELAEYILLLSDRLSSIYRDLDIVMKTSSDAGIVLSTYGELYFRGAIPGLQTLCPELFFVQVYVPDSMYSDEGVSYNMSLMDTLTHRLDTDDLGIGMARIGGLIGVSKGAAATLLCFGLCIGACVLASKKAWGVEAGVGISILISTLFALALGDIIFTIMIIAALVAALGLAFLFLFRRSA